MPRDEIFKKETLSNMSIEHHLGDQARRPKINNGYQAAKNGNAQQHYQVSAIRDYGEEARHFEDTVESDAEKQLHSTIAPMSQPTMVDESVSALQGNWDASQSSSQASRAC